MSSKIMKIVILDGYTENLGDLSWGELEKLHHHPHISWAAKESRQRLMDIAIEDLRQFIAEPPIHVVNS